MSYKVNDKEYDFNSMINQEIKKDFIGIHVHANVTQMADYIINKSRYDNDSDAPFCFEDIDNRYIDNTEDIKDLQEQITEIENKITTMEETGKDTSKLDEQLETLEFQKSEFETENGKEVEIEEYWIVSNFLAERLNKKGQAVLGDMWGRQTSGQGIILDAVISLICYDMEILEGQKNAWK